MTNTNLLTWGITVEDNKVIFEHGIFRGRLQVDVVSCASHDDALVEMSRRIAIKRTKQGYTTEIPTTVPGLPMLASNYAPDKLPPTIFIQPKLDGIRCVASNLGLLTRRSENITSVPHIKEALESLPPGIKLDGELYCHGLTFQDHLSRIKRDFAHPDFLSIKYHVFDIQAHNVPYIERKEMLRDIIEELGSTHVIAVPTYECHKDQIHAIASRHFKDYEGAILRDPAGLYLDNYRSHQLQKYKWTETVECQILDITAPTTGRSEGAAIYICVHPTTKQRFKVVPKLSIYLRQHMYRNKDLFLGYWTRVTYESLSTKGIPLKPRADGYASSPEGLQ